MAEPIELTEVVPEKSSSLLEAVIKDETKTPIAGSGLTTLTLTLYDEASGTIINGVQDADIKAEVDTNGKLTHTFSPADNAVIDSTKIYERHVALLKWTYGAGKAGNQEVRFRVLNMSRVT